MRKWTRKVTDTAGVWHRASLPGRCRREVARRFSNLKQDWKVGQSPAGCTHVTIHADSNDVFLDKGLRRVPRTG